MKIKSLILFIILAAFFFSTPGVALAIKSPNPNLKKIEPPVFVMDDWDNLNWQANGFPPLGGWIPGIMMDKTGDTSIFYRKGDEYIKTAKNIIYTYSDGSTGPKQVGLGFVFYPAGLAECLRANKNDRQKCLDYRILPDKEVLSNIRRLGQHFDNNPEFPNLKFIAIGCDCQGYGECTNSCSTFWNTEALKVASESFPHTTVFFQTGPQNFSNFASGGINKNIGVKCNGWALDADSGYIFKDGVLINGCLGGNEVYGKNVYVGLEPAHGGDVYWTWVLGLSSHPDFVDIQKPFFYGAKKFEEQIKFPLINFFMDHLGKRVTETPDVWLVMHENVSCTNDIVTRPCFKAPRKSYKSSKGELIEWAAKEGNFEFFLYQLDNLPNGKTELIYPKERPSCYSDKAHWAYYDSVLEVPELKAYNCDVANKDTNFGHPYNLFYRRTNQAAGNYYMYFKADDNYRFKSLKPIKGGGQTNWEITLTLFNKSFGAGDSFSLEYKDIHGQIKKQKVTKGASLGPVDRWVDYNFKLTDANFNNDFEGQADFRISSENDGDEIIHRVIVKRTSASQDCPNFELGNLDCDLQGLINEVDLNVLLSNWGSQSYPPYLESLLINWKNF